MHPTLCEVIEQCKHFYSIDVLPNDYTIILNDNRHVHITINKEDINELVIAEFKILASKSISIHIPIGGEEFFVSWLKLMRN